MAYRFFDCCFRVFTESFITFISAYNKNLLETVKHSCCLLNNELTKVERQKIMMNFVTLWLIVQKKVFAELWYISDKIENVSWPSSEQKLRKQDLEREHKLVDVDVDYFMQYEHTHSSEISQMLKTGYSSDYQKLQNHQKIF